MKYKKFIIHHYKAISGNIEIEVAKNSLRPIIGINESGKTSFLWAIFAFDENNDNLMGGKHLENVGNLYETSQKDSGDVSAIIDITNEELNKCLDEVAEDLEATDEVKSAIEGFRSKIDLLNNELILKRNLNTKKYSIENKGFDKFAVLNDEFCTCVMLKTPYILYFDDFRDSVEEVIEIVQDEGKSLKGWLAIIEQLFKKTNPEYSVLGLQTEEELRRKSILADVTAVLNKTLIDEWEKFSLEKGASLGVEINYEEREGRPYLRLLIREKVEKNDRYFGIQDRSKGFYWFFNFVMKLEFNPKVRNVYDKDTIYLLDEPGSYLHSSAQRELCKKLKALSEDNKVIFTTHSHYLLDPEVIPISYVNIAAKSSAGKITLVPLNSFHHEDRDKRSAIQPIIDSLQIKPFIFDLNKKDICIVEGIYDYYVFSMFRELLSEYKDIEFMPSVNAESVKYFISLCIFWGVNYIAIWDNDKEGNTEYKKAIIYFGDKEGEKFSLLKKGNNRKTILQDLLEGRDLSLIKKSLSLPRNTSFEKAIISLYFSNQRGTILKKISPNTQDNLKGFYGEVVRLMKSNYPKNSSKPKAD